MLSHALQFLARYGDSEYVEFITSMAIGADMPYEDAVLVNAMATHADIKPTFACLFAYIPCELPYP